MHNGENRSHGCPGKGLTGDYREVQGSWSGAIRDGRKGSVAQWAAGPTTQDAVSEN
jgi:hypothetical protein